MLGLESEEISHIRAQHVLAAVEDKEGGGEEMTDQGIKTVKLFLGAPASSDVAQQVRVSQVFQNGKLRAQVLVNIDICEYRLRFGGDHKTIELSLETHAS